MNPIYLLRYIKGYVGLKATGGFLERFINLSTASKIILWDTSYSENTFTSKCFISDVQKLRIIARKSGVSIKFVNLSGLQYDFKKQFDKIGLFAGAIFFMIFFAVMSCFVWSVDVTGNNKIPYNDIIKAAEVNGLKIGTFKPKFNETKAANQLSQNSNGKIDWCAFNIKGSKAIIEIRESKDSIKNSNFTEPCNIISDADGIILTLEIFDGISEVTVGNAVKKGDLLINGVSDNEDFSTLFIEAKGKITAKVKRKYCLSFSKFGASRKILKHKSFYQFELFSVKIPFVSVKSKKAYLMHKEHLTFNNTNLPISFNIFTNYVDDISPRSRSEILISSLEKFSYEARIYNSNSILLSERPVISENKNCFIIENEWDSITFIGEKQKISIEN